MVEPSPKRRKISPVTDRSGDRPDLIDIDKKAEWLSFLSPITTVSEIPESQGILRGPGCQSPGKSTFNSLAHESISIHGKPPVLRPRYQVPSDSPKKPRESTTGSRSTNRTGVLPARTVLSSGIPNDDSTREPRASPPEAVTAAGQLNSTGESNVDLESLSKSPAANTNNDPQTPANTSRPSPEYSGEGEPRLPSTPTQLGLESPPKPPSGLRYSSGSSRKSRSLVRPASLSSPLKPRNRVSPSSVSLSKDPRTSTSSTSRKTDDAIRVVEIPSPNSALEVKLHIVYDGTETLIKDVNIATVSDWAGGELGPLLNELAPGKDLPFLREVVVQYWALSEERARCWTACERAVRQIMSPHHVPCDPEPSIEDPAYQFLGRQHLVVHRNRTSLVVRWQILQCPCTVLRRHISAYTTFGEYDVDNALVGGNSNEVGEAFNALIRSGKEVPEAIEVLVKTLFDDT
ncbi:MAG: hypothetical protein L6R35_007203 [Caloplaca aegaea]|nr:MAG: hypothetical protein L6R35_007203 [Caloplaca aegaea]